MSTLAAGGALASGLLVSRSAHAAGSDTLKVGLIGCGGRGTGAVGNAFAADSNLNLTAVADAFEDRALSSLDQLRKTAADRVNVDADHLFSGFDAYEKLLATDVDVVILATAAAFSAGAFEGGDRIGQARVLREAGGRRRSGHSQRARNDRRGERKRT